tara:strand:- start:1456 stop:2100 length:645 start_codon:yes stop_codon:yes gene_type:complete
MKEYFERLSIQIGSYLDNTEKKLFKLTNATKPSEKTAISTAFNFFIVMVVVLPIDLLFQHLTRADNSLLFFQKIVARFVYHTEKLMGIDVSLTGVHQTELSYAEIPINLEIVSQCTGLHETLFLGLLVICFRGVNPYVRLKWAGIFAVLIFIENAIRIISFYPVTQAYDFQTWDKLHYFWWHTGQYALLMTAFILWVSIVANNPNNRTKLQSNS